MGRGSARGACLVWGGGLFLRWVDRVEEVDWRRGEEKDGRCSMRRCWVVGSGVLVSFDAIGMRMVGCGWEGFGIFCS